MPERENDNPTACILKTEDIDNFYISLLFFTLFQF